MLAPEIGQKKRKQQFSRWESLKTPHSYSGLERRSLELKPQRKLNVACTRTAGRHNRLCDHSCRASGCFRKWGKVIRRTPECHAVGEREVGMVQDVKKFGAELNQSSFSQKSYFGVLNERKVPIPERRSSQDIPPGIAQLAHIGGAIG